MENWVTELLLKWRSEDVMLNPPASVAEIERVESVLDFKFPQDFKEVYLQANGFDDYEWQEHMFSFWSLSRIVEEMGYAADGDFIGFCDFLIMSHCIGFVRNEQGIFKNYFDLEKEKIAETYQDVVHMINSSNNNIY